jgi:D-alanine transaminase
MQEAGPIVYLNRQFMPKHEATLSVEDRGTLFADGVYEVLRYYDGQPFALEDHLARLQRSLSGIDLHLPYPVDELGAISDRLVRENQLAQAKVYWQITRGPATRQHAFPARPAPTVLMLAYPDQPLDAASEPPALSASLQPDRRWADCWIKSLMLLPNVLARQAAAQRGADEAILQHEGRVTEGSATSVMMVKNGQLYTHPLNGSILGSITRQILLQCAEALSIPAYEQVFTVEAMLNADEVLICGTTTHVAGITHVDDKPISTGQVGAVTCRLHDALIQRIARDCDLP